MSATAPENLPLFPLGRPLYPGVAMQLRIFEQRYLTLVRESMRTGRPFGIVPITNGREVGVAPAFFPWGTLVSITDFDQRADGLLGITISGFRRFQVLDHSVADDGLIVADAENLAEEPSEPCSSHEEDLLRLLQDLVCGLQMGDIFPDRAPTLAELSWRLATLLPLPAEIKLALLKESDVHIRLDILRECLVDLSGGQQSAD